MEVMPFFWSKTAEHLEWCGQVCSSITHREMDTCTERPSKKNSVKPSTVSHNNASWCTDTDGFLEHSLSGGSLYYKGPAHPKIISFFLDSPLYTMRLDV